MKIVKQGIVNYLSNLKFFFVPLGTLFLGIILGLSISLPLLSNTLHTIVNKLSGLSLELDFGAFTDSLSLAVNELDWTNSITALTTMFSRSWLENTLTASLKALVTNYDAYVLEIEGIVFAAINEIVFYVVVFAVFILLGFVGGYFLTKYLVRQEIAKRSLLQFIVVTLIDGFLSATLVVFCMWLLSLWQVSALFSTLFSYLLFATISLLEAYLCYGAKKVKASKVINFHNSSSLIISDSIVILVAWALSSLCAILFNELAGSVIGFTLMEIAFIVIGLNAEAYVIDLVEGKKAK